MVISCAGIGDIPTPVWHSQRLIISLFEGAVYPHCATDSNLTIFGYVVRIGLILFVLAMLVSGFLIPVA
jgi:hypothetical protein